MISFQFLRREIPVRLSNIMKEINLLPSSLLQMPSCLLLQVRQIDNTEIAKNICIITLLLVHYYFVVYALCSHGIASILLIWAKDIRLHSFRFLDWALRQAYFFHRFFGNHSNWNFRNLEFRGKNLEFSKKNLEFSQKSLSLAKNPWV